MHCVEGSFEIKKDNHAKALEAIKSLAGKETISDGSGRHFSWVDTEDFIEATSLYDAIAVWGWEPEEAERGGDIIGISFIREKLGDEEVLFNAIAPYVEADSYIEMQGEDGERWRWVFDGKICKEVSAKIVWE